MSTTELKHEIAKLDRAALRLQFDYHRTPRYDSVAARCRAELEIIEEQRERLLQQLSAAGKDADQ